jgi:hypothetical protein
VYGQTLSLLGPLESESLSAVNVPENLPQFGYLFYSATFPDGRALVIHLDAHGDLLRVDYKLGLNRIAVCSPGA